MRAIHPQNNHGGIRLRFTAGGTRYGLQLKGLRFNDATDIATSYAIAARITADIQSQNFDATLARYELTIASQPTQLSLIDIWDAWVRQSSISEYAQAGHYATVRKAILRGEALPASLSASNFNLRRRMLSSALDWAVEKGFAAKNDYARMKAKRASRAQIAIFTRNELRAILSAIARDSPKYLNFAEFLILSGCRFGEAAAIRPAVVDLPQSSVTINAAVRFNILQGRTELHLATKTGSTRVLKSSALASILQRAIWPSDEHAPIFTAPRGGLITRSNFRTKVWAPALASANVPYRRMHILRHTALSYALASGLSVPEVAYLAGHADGSMIVRTYGHILERPSLPDMSL